jgi:hypothetical protein
MSNSTKSVSAFTIKKATFDLNEYNKSYSNTPLYRMVEDMVEQKVKAANIPSPISQVYDYFYDRSDLRVIGEVETYYIVGYKDEYNMADSRKPFLAKFIYNRLISYFNQYLSSTLYDLGNEDTQKLVDALSIVYRDNSSDINQTFKLVDKLWDVYSADDSLETNWDVRDKITEGFQQSGYYKEFVSFTEELIIRKFDIKKEFATQTLLEAMLGDKVNRVDNEYGVEFQAQLKHYNQLQSEIAELNNEINNL